ncbi:uncharacterized protein LOC113225507 [Hyposmocoma kahamanoa]|uniref:uncharacterized protein LOC113225507 n=1 Tax=Hyposmocoma kahamanoa TaxID=1477025 RepID=UPI000E6D669A|nr:uncharacterized protein LOC113225507 [Hyposmocoma kahamanoa]
MKKCSGCGRFAAADDFARCTKCPDVYCKKCRKTGIVPEDWLCPACVAKQPRKSCETPLKGVQDVTISDQTNNQPLTADVIRAIIRSELAELQTSFEKRIVHLIAEKTKELTKEIESLKESQAFINKEFEDTKKEFTQSQVHLKKALKENEALNSTITNLNVKLLALEQHSRKSNIEIQCIPERKSENLIKMVLQISKTTGSNITEEHIHHCTRVSKINATNSRPRSVVIQFASPRVRDTFLAAVLKFNRKKQKSDKLSTKQAGISGDAYPIYVVEHLTLEQKNLHAATRLKAKKLGYKYILVRNGRILVRATDSSEYVVIRDLNDLNTLKELEIVTDKKSKG